MKKKMWQRCRIRRHKDRRLMYRKYILVLCTILFVSLCNLQAQSDGPTVSITTNKGCGDNAQFAVGEIAVISWELTGAQSYTQYRYEMTVYAGISVLNKWYGELETDRYGNWSVAMPGVISPPLGAHEVKIEIYDCQVYYNYITNPHATNTSVLTSDTCVYYVKGEVVIPGTECSCEAVELTATLNKATVKPGDTCTLTVTADNRMKCGFIFLAQSMEIDLGELGGIVRPMNSDRRVAAGDKETLATYTFTIPKGSEGEYSVNIFYSDRDCTWTTYTSLTVEKEEPKGTISVLSLTTPLEINKSGYARVKVTNPSGKATTYTVKVSASSGIRFAQFTYSVQVEGNSSKEVRVNFTAQKEGTHTLTFELQAGGRTLDSVSRAVKVTKTSKPAKTSRPTTTYSKGTISVVSRSRTLKVNEKGSVTLEVTNPSDTDITYTILIEYPENAIKLNPGDTRTLRVKKRYSSEITIHFTALKEGNHTMRFNLRAGNQRLGSTSSTIRVEAPSTIPYVGEIDTEVLMMLMGGVAFFALIGGIVMKLTPDRKLSARKYEKNSDKTKERGDSQEDAENYVKKANVYRKIGKVGKAVGLYKKAADIYRHLNLLARARETEEKAAKTYEEAGLRAQEKGDLQKAADYFEKAAGLWKKANNVEKPVELYEKAADLWRNTGNEAKAKEAEEKTAESYEEAGILADRITEYQRAAELYEKAADLFRKTGNVEKSIELYKKAAKIQRQRGNPTKAKEAEEKAAETYVEAGTLGHLIGEFQKAGDYYEKATDLWRKTGNESKAREVERVTAVAYERAGDKSKEAGKFQKAGELYEKAADIWRKTGNKFGAKEAEEKALEAYEKAHGLAYPVEAE